MAMRQKTSSGAKSEDGLMTKEWRRRAWAALLVPLVPLIPGLVLLLMPIIGGEGSDNAVVRWAQEYWWFALVIGGAGFLLLSVVAAWVLRCRDCGYRLSRAGIKASVLINDFAGVRRCPHCGNSLTDDAPTKRT